MLISNGGGFFPPPFGPASFNGMANSFGMRSTSIPPYYTSPFQPQHQQQQQHHHHHHPQQQQQQQQSQQPQHRPASQQTSENNPNMTSYKLYDLDTSNHSEIIRLIFSFAGVSFKDRRFKKDEWIKIKEQIIFEQLPVLRVNSQFKVFPLHAIIRYLAREFNLYGAGKHDHVVIDVVLETARQLQEKVSEIIENSTDHEQALLQFIAVDSATYLKQLEKLHEIFDRHGPFYLGTNISLADLFVHDTINYLIKIDSKLLENYPHLKGARRRLEKHPWISNFVRTKAANQSKTHHPKSPPPLPRPRTKSPSPNINAHHHRHRSHEGYKSNHHHRHHHCPYHTRHHSKEPPSISQARQRSIRLAQSPNLPIKDKEPTPMTQRSIRISKSSSISTRDKAQTPVSHAKQRMLRPSKSPSVSTNDTEPTSLSQARQRIQRKSKSPNTSINDKEPTSTSQATQRSIRTSKSSNISTNDKELAPLPHSRQRSIRSSKSPSNLTKDKEAALRSTDIIPAPPPITKEHKSESTAN